MSYVNDTKPSTSYTNDGTPALIAWASSQATWADPLVSWIGLGSVYSNDTRPTTSYTNDTI